MESLFEAVGRTGYDKEYRERFLSDPRKTLSESGVHINPDTEIVLIMNEPKKLHLVIPAFSDQPIALPADHPIFDQEK